VTGAVGVVVNPLAGKDIRRLVASASHTSDASKIGTVRRAVVAAVESGATRVLVAGDPHRLAERAVDGLELPVEVLDEPVTGSRLDSTAAAARMWKEHVGALVVLGGDGTCRDIALGWPDAPLIAISTGTNNVYPSALDGTSAGCAAGLVASGRVPFGEVSRRSKRISVHVPGDDIPDDLALVDLAHVATTFVGSRAVWDPTTVRTIVAAFATPASTGLSSVAGRVSPVDRWTGGGVVVQLGSGGRRVRVPLGPGTFTTVEVSEVRRVAIGEPVQISGAGVLAFDGERDRRIPAGVVVTATVDVAGPWVIDVERTLAVAAGGRLFDETGASRAHGEGEADDAD
jgi:predicted polyphosphate/ATP-dependent NAD kinase